MQAPSGNGSTLVQTYRITNNTGASKVVSLSRYLEGDLYFVGSFGNDFGGVSADRKTVFQFDTGDDPNAPTTFVGITSTGGTAAGYAVWPYRFTSATVAAGKIQPDIRNKIYQDADNDRITDTGFDAGIIQQNNITIPAGATVSYVTRTRFGSGSIVAQVSKLSGCVTLNGQPVVDRTVEARQTGLATQTTKPTRPAATSSTASPSANPRTSWCACRPFRNEGVAEPRQCQPGPRVGFRLADRMQRDRGRLAQPFPLTAPSASARCGGCGR